MKNYKNVLGMFGMVLALGLVLGCATIKIDEGSLKTISLQSKDLATVGAQMGYPERRVDLLGFFPGSAPAYPKAEYCTFTTTVKGIKRDGIWIRSFVDTRTTTYIYEVGYTTITNGYSRWVNIGTYATLIEANNAATSSKIQNPEWAPYIEVKPYEGKQGGTETLDYIGFKPL